jgi:P4 family phage/plasmid primase-like protien
MKENLIFTEAFRQAVLGRSVMPIKSDKKPYLSSWKDYQKKLSTEDDVTRWWEQWPKANLGIITGKISGIIVVDIDSYKGNSVSVDLFPETYTVRTGNGGTHLYYQYTEGLTISANAYPQYPNLDIRSDGGFVVAAPSVTSYIKDDKEVGGEYSVIKNIELAPFPIEMFINSKFKKSIGDLVSVKTGGRNDSLASLIGTLLLSHKESLWFTNVLPAVEKINATYSPPLPKSEFITTFNSVVNMEKNRRLSLSGGKKTEEEDMIRQAFIKNKATGTYEIALYLVKKYEIVTIGEKELEMYVYRDGIYFQAVNEIIYPEIQRILGQMVTQNAKYETFHKVAGMTMYPRSIFTTAALNFIPLLNGVYNTETKMLLQHDAKYKFTYQLPITYDKDAVCPKTIAFFDQILTEEQRTVIEEWIGYYFYRNYMFKKAIIFVGEGDTGKTTLLEVIDFLLSKKNTSAVSLQKITTDKFAAAQLFEKHGNLVDELSARDIADTGNFKIATGGGSISGEYKFGNQFSFNNFSKLTFACNRIPDVKDFDDDAYFNRWLIIRFENHIVKKIPDFIKTLTTDEERSGLFNLAMVALTRLIKQGKFSYSRNAFDTKIEMLRAGSSIAIFASDALKQSLGAEMTKSEMYRYYTDFCLARELPADSLTMLAKKLPTYLTYISEGPVAASFGKRETGWRNVEFITEKNEEIEKAFYAL